MTSTDHSLTSDDGLTLAATWHRADEATHVRPVVVAVHGYPDDARVWDALIPHLLCDADVLTYDVRGCGRSDAPATRDGYRLDHLAADLDAVVRHAGSEGADVHVLAHDWGSIQAWHALTGDGAASRVRSFVTSSGPCLDHVERWVRASMRGSARQRAAVLRQVAASAYIPFFTLPVLPEVAINTGALTALLSHTGDGRAQRHAGRPEPDRRSARNGLQLYRANMLTREPLPTVARTTSVPTLAVVATKDRYVRPPLATCGASYVADLRTTRVEAGHWAIVTHPAQVAAAVRGHVAG